ncbi:MAG: hypothetical protein EOO88_31985 [Pedobacter sp.]|nr:MAG: hypothetical protein EOO88_31985 [Pedobacter sp.]
MKTITISQGTGIDYVAMQDATMEVFVAKVNEENVAEFGKGLSLGVLGDIDNSDVRNLILTKMYPGDD